jgi:hypothetical protein
MPFTPEDRIKSQAARKAAIAASQHFKRDWLDSDHWESLAKTKRVRLPIWSKRPTPRRLKQWHESLDTETFEAVYGCSPSRLIALNPHTPLRAFVGMMLERSK